MRAEPTRAKSMVLGWAVVLGSCTAQSRDDAFDSGVGSASAPASADDTSDAMDDSGAASSPSTDPDETVGDATTHGTAIRCDKIDILFMLETELNQGGETELYGQYHQQLFDGFTTLVSELYVSLEVDDFRVMVTGSMPPQPDPSCAFDEATMEQQCSDVTTDECDLVLGAGRNGFDYPLQSKFTDEENPHECMAGRWLESGQPDLGGMFSCLFYYYWFNLDASGGSGGSRTITGAGPDRLMDSMTAAIGPESGEAACNSGFLRDDALLVVILFAPSEDGLADTSSGTVATWSQALADAKHGIAENVVVLALTADGDLEQPLCSAAPVGELPTRLRELVDGTTHGKWASSCLPDYGPFFTAAADVVDAACDEFTPEG